MFKYQNSNYSILLEIEKGLFPFHFHGRNLSRRDGVPISAAATARSAIVIHPPAFLSQLQRSLRAVVPADSTNRLFIGGPVSRPNVRVRAAATSATEIRERWLGSLSSPYSKNLCRFSQEIGESDAGLVIGIDPDVSGALALLKPDGSAQVFDTPHVQALVGKRARKRLDARSIVQLIHSFKAPLGTTAYIEQSIPYPKDGKQGWWSGGYTYGLWIGILVASGFTVVPISSRLWKDHFELFGTSSKDDSRKTASLLFPQLSSQLKRKKDHGRAESLLIAAYAMGLKIDPKMITSEEKECCNIG